MKLTNFDFRFGTKRSKRRQEKSTRVSPEGLCDGNAGRSKGLKLRRVIHATNGFYSG